MGSRKTRKSVPWKGWGKLAPHGAERTRMYKKCGKKCFLGTKFGIIASEGGVIPAIENEYFRTAIQEEVQRERKALRNGERKIIGVNYLSSNSSVRPRGELVKIPMSDKKRQIHRTKGFKKANKLKADSALKTLQQVAISDGNVFEELIQLDPAARENLIVGSNYYYTIDNPDNKNTAVKATINGTEMFVPLDLDNADFIEIQRQVDAGTVTIEEAD